MPQRIAVVTGASSGIGRATAVRLAVDGFHVLAVGRDERALSDACREIERGGGSAERLVVDVTSDEAPRLIVGRAQAKSDAGTSGGIDALVNAAGIISAAAITATTDADWDEMMTINV